MSDINDKERFRDKDGRCDNNAEYGVADDDLLMEQILDNVNNTPIGQVLKRIASLPEVRQEKVLGIRRQLTDGDYDLNRRLDAAMDRVLEELIQ
jgi:hypothetical protein